MQGQGGRGAGLRLRGGGVAAAAGRVVIACDGVALEAIPGESLAAALTAAGRWSGVFCGMGVCDSCRVTVDGVPGQRACTTAVRPGMRVGAGAAGGDAGGGEAAPGRHHAAVVVVGAGPGGLAAALAAAGRGLQVVVLDERAEPGGQYFKPLARSHRHVAAPDRQAAAGMRLVAAVRQAGARLLGGAAVWHAQPREGGGATLGVVRDGRDETWTAERLIVATGAYERAWVVPGWTLPGVMTTGAAQTLVRANRVAPGRAVLVAGNGPLNLQLAAELAAAGHRVVALAEAAAGPLRSPVRAVRLAAASPALAWDGVRQLAALRSAGVPVLHRHVLVRIEGEGRAERAVLARVGGDGLAVPGSERAFRLDAVCVGYGFLPSNELTRLVGARHRAAPGDPGALLVDCDGGRRTSVPGVYAAGDAGGALGARAAMAQGALAGHAAADDQGAPRDPGMVRRARVRLRRARGFQRALWRMFRSGARAEALATGDTVLCRCEGVTVGQARELISAGAGLGPLKRATRAGMGTCQGRYCGPVLAALAGAGGQLPGFAPQAPLRPVRLDALAARPEVPEPPLVTLPRGLARPGDGRLGSAAFVIVGGGIIGVCAGLALAREGRDVLLVERGEPNGEASGGNAGSLHVQLLGYAFPDLDAAEAMAPVLRLARDAAARWEELAAELGADIELKRKGGFSIADTPELVRRLERKAAMERRAGLQVEVLPGAEARRMAPALSRSILAAAFSADEGQVNPQLAGPAILAAAVRAGMRVLPRTAVTGLVRGHAGFEVLTTAGTVRAGKVLNAAGAWSAEVAATLGIALPTRAAPLQMMVTEPLPPLLEHLVAHVLERLTVKQARRGNVLIGGGWRARVDAGSGRRMPTPEGMRGNVHTALAAIPALATARLIRSWTAMNVGTVGPPIVSSTPGDPGLVHAATSNGLTYGPVIGQICADMLTGRAPGYDVRPFALG